MCQELEPYSTGLLSRFKVLVHLLSTVVIWMHFQTDNEISFSKGDIIVVLSKADPDWWYGRNETAVGGEG